jgi:hypothetical protein
MNKINKKIRIKPVLTNKILLRPNSFHKHNKIFKLNLNKIFKIVGVLNNNKILKINNNHRLFNKKNFSFQENSTFYKKINHRLQIKLHKNLEIILERIFNKLHQPNKIKVKPPKFLNNHLINKENKVISYKINPNNNKFSLLLQI